MSTRTSGLLHFRCRFRRGNRTSANSTRIVTISDWISACRDPVEPGRRESAPGPAAGCDLAELAGHPPVDIVGSDVVGHGGQGRAAFLFRHPERLLDPE